MLQEMNGAIHELAQTMSVTNTAGMATSNVGGNGLGMTSNCLDYWPNTVYWNSYPVYVCTDKTKKAIEVLKALQAEKMVTCNSVPRFIELVDKIAGLL